jgi:hypothetical protein
MIIWTDDPAWVHRLIFEHYPDEYENGGEILNKDCWVCVPFVYSTRDEPWRFWELA